MCFSIVTVNRQHMVCFGQIQVGKYLFLIIQSIHCVWFNVNQSIYALKHISKNSIEIRKCDNVFHFFSYICLSRSAHWICYTHWTVPLKNSYAFQGSTQRKIPKLRGFNKNSYYILKFNKHSTYFKMNSSLIYCNLCQKLNFHRN